MATKAIAPKVWSATILSYLGSTGLLAILQAVNDNHALLGGLPPQVASFVYGFIPALLTLVAGYVAKHQVRPEDATVIQGEVVKNELQAGLDPKDDEYVTDVDTTQDDA